MTAEGCAVGFPPEGEHEVCVALQGRPAAEHARRIISEDGHILLVAVAPSHVARPVCEEDVRLLVPRLCQQTSTSSAI